MPMRIPVIAVLVLAAAPPACGQDVQRLGAEEVARFPARQAGQGAAADASHFYAIDNSAIGRYDRKSGEAVAEWSLHRDGAIRHLIAASWMRAG